MNTRHRPDSTSRQTTDTSGWTETKRTDNLEPPPPPLSPPGLPLRPYNTQKGRPVRLHNSPDNEGGVTSKRAFRFSGSLQRHGTAPAATLQAHYISYVLAVTQTGKPKTDRSPLPADGEAGGRPCSLAHAGTYERGPGPILGGESQVQCIRYLGLKRQAKPALGSQTPRPREHAPAHQRQATAWRNKKKPGDASEGFT